MIAVPKGWKLIPQGTAEKVGDRFRFVEEGGHAELERWSPITSANDCAESSEHFYIIRLSETK